MKALYGDLRPDLDHPVGRQLEIARRVVGVLGKKDEEPVLPGRHAGSRVRSHRASRQEERGRHNVEGPAELPGDGEGFRNVWPLHESEMQDDAHESIAEPLHLHAILWRDPWNVLGDDSEDHIALMQYLVVLEAMQQRSGSALWRRGEEYGGAGYARRLAFPQ